MTGTERRHHARVDLPSPLRGSLDLRTDVQVLNLSPTGVLIEHGAPLCPGQACSLFLPLDGETLRLRARIVWSQVDGFHAGPGGRRELRYRSGLQFSDLPEADQARILQYLATHGGPRPRSLAMRREGQAGTAAPAHPAEPLP